MKKLMTMIAAVATAFGLFAAEPSITDNAVNFSEFTDVNPWTLTDKDGGADALWTWSDTTPATDEAKIASKKLVLKTGAKILARKFASSAVTVDDENGLFANVKLDFQNQGIDADSIPTATELTGAKLALFLLDTSDVEGAESGTNLFAIAGYGSTRALYQLSAPVDYLSGEHTFTIKFYNQALSASNRAGFMIYVDGENAGSEATALKALWCYELNGDTFDLTKSNRTACDKSGFNYLGGLTVNPSLTTWYNEQRLLVSLVQNEDQTFAGVEFKGNASIASIQLTDDKDEFKFIPADANAMTIKSSDKSVTIVNVTGGEGFVSYANGTITAAAGSTPELTGTISYAAGYILKATGVDITQVDETTITFTFEKDAVLDLTAKPVAAYVTIDGVKTPYETFEAAFGAAKDSDGSMLTLNDDIDGFEYDGENSMILDLAGKTISGDGVTDGLGVIYVTAGALTITNSVPNLGGVVATGTDGIAVNNAGEVDEESDEFVAAGTVTIVGGKFDGLVQNFYESAPEAMTYAGITASAGSFTFDPTGKFLADRKVATYDGEKYWVVGDKPSAGFVIQLVGNVQQSGDAESGFTFTTAAPSTLKMFINGVEQASAASFTPEDWYETKQYVVVSEVLPAEAVPTHKWFEKAAGRNLGVVAKVGPFTKVGNGEGPVGGADQEFFGVCGGTGGGWAKLVTKANIAANAEDGVYTVAYDAAVACKLRGGAVCKKLNTFLAFGDGAGKMMSLPLNATEVVFAEDATPEKPQNAFLIDEPCAMSEGAFSTDGQYLWAVNEDTKAVTKRDTISLYKINKGLKGDGEGHFTWVRDVVVNSAGARMIKVANVNGKDVVYCMLAGTAGIQAFDATAESPVVQTIVSAGVLTDNTYGAINVVDSSDAAPHLTIYTCKNGGYGIASASKLIVYTLAADGLSAAAVDPIEWTVPELAEEAIGFGGPIGRHCIDLFASENEKTMYIAMSVFDNGTADGSGRTYIFQVESCEYVDFILNDEKATDTSVTNMYRKAAVIAEAPAPAETENFKGWFTDSEKTVAAEFPLTLNADTELWAKYESEQPIVPVKPGEDIKPAPGTTIDDINNNDEVKALYLKAPGDITTTKDYRDLFKAVAGSAEGTVKFVLNTAGEAAVEAAEKAADTTVLAAALDADAATATVENPLTGFYYSLKQNADVTKLGFKAGTDKNLLGGKDTVTFTLEKNPTSEFYQMIVTPAPVE